jgi:hypothetical protein
MFDGLFKANRFSTLLKIILRKIARKKISSKSEETAFHSEADSGGGKSAEMNPCTGKMSMGVRVKPYAITAYPQCAAIKRQ